MTGSIRLVGHPRAVGLTPTNTSQATMFTAQDNNTAVTEIWVANTSGSTRQATVKWGNGVTDYPIISSFDLAGNTYFHEDIMIPLRTGYTLKVTSGAANDITFTITVIEGGSAFGGRSASSG